MPVRIYDISKKLGLENKEVLAKAKVLGIAAARVASSSLDKITAEYLEQQLVQDHPNLAPPAAPAPVPFSTQVHEPIVLVTGPPPEAQTAQNEEAGAATATALLEPEAPKTETTREPPEASTAEAISEPEP